MYTDALTLRHACGGGPEESHLIGLPTISAQGKCGNVLFHYAMVVTMRKCSYTLKCIVKILIRKLAGVLEAE